jgi:hypothetical protein
MSIFQRQGSSGACASAPSVISRLKGSTHLAHHNMSANSYEFHVDKCIMSLELLQIVSCFLWLKVSHERCSYHAAKVWIEQHRQQGLQNRSFERWQCITHALQAGIVLLYFFAVGTGTYEVLLYPKARAELSPLPVPAHHGDVLGVVGNSSVHGLACKCARAQHNYLLPHDMKSRAHLLFVVQTNVAQRGHGRPSPDGLKTAAEDPSSAR